MQTKHKTHCTSRNSMHPMKHKLNMSAIPRGSMLHECRERNHPQERKKEKVNHQMRSRLHAFDDHRGSVLIVLCPAPLARDLRLPRIPYKKISFIARYNSASDSPKVFNLGLSYRLIVNSQNTA